MITIIGDDGLIYKLMEDKCIISHNYALVNYEEIIDWYKQPFYKKWFSNPPRKVLVTYTKHN